MVGPLWDPSKPIYREIRKLLSVALAGRVCTSGVTSPEKPNISLAGCSYRQTISAIPPYLALWGFGCLNMKRLGAVPAQHAYLRLDTPHLSLSRRYLRDNA